MPDPTPPAETSNGKSSKPPGETRGGGETNDRGNKDNGKTKRT